MNRNCNRRCWLLAGFLGVLGAWQSAPALADDRPQPDSSAASGAPNRAPEVVLDRWGDVRGRLVTKAANRVPEAAGAPAQSEFVGLEDAVIFAHAVSRVHQSYLPDDWSRLPSAVLEVGHEGLKPHVVPLQVGQTLVLRNANSRPHVVRIQTPLEQGTNLLIGPSQEQTVTFRYSQAVPVAATCSLHEEKPAYVFAVTHPYVAVTDASGEFVLRDLPADEPIELRVWHERARRRGGVIVTSPEWTAGQRLVVVSAGAILDLGESLVETTSPPIRK